MPNIPTQHSSLAGESIVNPTNPVNLDNTTQKFPFNTFPLSHHNYRTLRFGDLTPFFVAEGVKNDNFRIGSTHDIKSYTLNSPIMADIKINKDYFMVPLPAIYPINFEKMYCNPTHGDDIPSDAYPYTNIVSKAFVDALVNNIRLIADFSDSTTANDARLAFGSLRLFELIFSKGSLASTLRLQLWPTYDTFITVSNKEVHGIEEVLTQIYTSIFSTGFFAVRTDLGNFYVLEGFESSFSIGGDLGRVTPVKLRQLVELYKIHVLSSTGGVYIDQSLASLPTAVRNVILSFNSVPVGVADVSADLTRLYAYQLTCAQFYTNDNIDFIYTSQLWLENQKSIYEKACIGYYQSEKIYPRFSFNGISCEYDVLSSKRYSFIKALLQSSSVPTVNKINALRYFFNIFEIQHSLRFGDYFTGARPEPLANGDISTPVVGNAVNAIDITQNLLKARFFLAINRSSARFSKYVKALFNGKPLPPDYHEPKFISHNEFSLSGQIVNNTSDSESSENTGLGAQVTNISSTSDNYEYDTYIDMPCIVLGIASFQSSRIYNRASDRQFFHRDRFDWFNPFLQNIGDQPVKATELNLSYGTFDKSEDISYHQQDMEYKQSFNSASGGFLGLLKGYIYTNNNLDEYKVSPVISPDFIRQMSTDFDVFFSSLNWLSDGYDFHFIVDFNNTFNPTRQMIFNPQILF